MNRLHILISDKLNPIYGCVQGGHAIAQWLLDNKEGWNNEVLVYLQCDINKWAYKLHLLNVKHSCFYEPDLDNKLTAIAVLNNHNLFKNLKLIK